LTSVWLSVHLLVLTGTATVAFASATTHSDLTCTCAHGDDHGLCPMHGTPRDAARCRLQGTQDNLANALISLIGPQVLPATSNSAIVDAGSPGPIVDAAPLPLDWIVPPDPPPPRP
jgi:hypothetical protein